MENTWTSVEDEQLLKLKAESKSYEEIGDCLGRTGQSVRGRYRRITRTPVRDVESDSLFRTYSPVPLRAAIFDLETTDFVASGIRGHLVCCSIFPLDAQEPYTLSIEFKDQRDDKRLLLEVIAELSNYDILIGHNISSFDLNWITTRLLYHGIPIPTYKWLIYDTYQAARRMAIKADRKSMAFLCDFFRMQYVKTSVLPVSWGMIDSPNEAEFEKSLGDIQYHCEEDTKANRQLFYALWPMDRMPNGLPIAKRI